MQVIYVTLILAGLAGFHVLARNSRPEIRLTTPPPETVAYGDRTSVEVAFTADDADGDPVTASWRLNGSDWSEATPPKVALNLVAPGEYRFEMRAEDDKGAFSETVSSTFKVLDSLPPTATWVSPGVDQMVLGSIAAYNILNRSLTGLLLDPEP